MAALTEEKHLRRSDVNRVLLLIIESGAIYCAMQVCYLLPLHILLLNNETSLNLGFLHQLIYPVLDAKLLYTPNAVPSISLAAAVNIFGVIYSAITVSHFFPKFARYWLYRI
jgi:hypothetical protein